MTRPVLFYTGPHTWRIHYHDDTDRQFFAYITGAHDQ